MILKRIIYLLVCINFLCACSFNQESNSVKNKIYNLKHKGHCEIYLAQPQLAVTDSFIIIVSPKQSEGICQLYSIENNMEMVCTYGRIGNGPNDFLQPMLTYTTGNTFGLNDLNLSTLAIIRIEQNENSISIKEEKKMKAPYKPMKKEFVPRDICYLKLGKGHYVSSLFAGDGCFFTLSDSLLQPIMRFGESPIKEELSSVVSRSRLRGKTAVYDNTFFYATSDLPYIASYTLQKDSMIKAWSRFYRKPYYAISNGDLKYNKEYSTGPLLDMKVDSNYIYLLYMDQLLSEYDYNTTDKSCSNKIYVFNHKGDDVAILNLDCRLSQIAIDSKRKKIYGIAENPEISLVEFELPSF